ncbi:MAG: cytochrome c biogenesis protein CcsA, partial [Planctomycetota bacterium]
APLDRLGMPQSRRDTLRRLAEAVADGDVVLSTAADRVEVAEQLLAIKGIGSSYLIFFYHFPSALSCYAFFTLLMVCSIAYLVKDDPLWDRAGRTAGQLGLLACTITLTTGSTWASAAWNAWWVWDDPRLMTAAIMWLTYAGYVMLQVQLDDPVKRRRYCAVFGILAFLNIPVVHYAIQWFGGEVSHPMKFDEMSAPTIVFARWFGVFVFVMFYALVYRWRIAREAVRDRLSEGLWTIRRLEEGARG